MKAFLAPAFHALDRGMYALCSPSRGRYLSTYAPVALFTIMSGSPRLSLLRRADTVVLASDKQQRARTPAGHAPVDLVRHPNVALALIVLGPIARSRGFGFCEGHRFACRCTQLLNAVAEKLNGFEIADSGFPIFSQLILRTGVILGGCKGGFCEFAKENLAQV